MGPWSGSPDIRQSGGEPGWWWRLETSDGAEVDVEGVGAQTFPSQGDAESWVGEYWRDLVEGGADAVTLFHGDHQVYGPMSLRA